jgi:hypothetical protein
VGIRTIIVIVANNELLELAVLAELAPNVLVEGVEVVLELGGVHAVLRIVRRVLVEVGHENGLTVGGLDVLSGAAVAVSTSTDFLAGARVSNAEPQMRAAAFTLRNAQRKQWATYEIE